MLQWLILLRCLLGSYAFAVNVTVAHFDYRFLQVQHELMKYTTVHAVLPSRTLLHTGTVAEIDLGWYIGFQTNPPLCRMTLIEHDQDLPAAVTDGDEDPLKGQDNLFQCSHNHLRIDPTPRSD